MTDKPKKAPEKQEVYCTVANSPTSEGRIHHGDTVKLPKAEAEALIAKGAVK